MDPPRYGRWRSLRYMGGIVFGAVVIGAFVIFVPRPVPRPVAQPPIRLLLAMDLSSSMNCEVEPPAAQPEQRLLPRCANPDVPNADPRVPQDVSETKGLRIGAAVDGAIDGLAWFGRRDRLGIWTFSGDGVVDRVTGQTVSGQSGARGIGGDFPAFNRAMAANGLRGLLLEAAGGTPLNLAIYYGVRALRAYWQPGLNALVILTDGYDHTSTLNGARLDPVRLTKLLSRGLQPRVHVLVTTAGEDVDCTKILEDIRAFEYDPKRDCFAVSRDRDVQAAFRRVGERLRELARRP